MNERSRKILEVFDDKLATPHQLSSGKREEEGEVVRSGKVKFKKEKKRPWEKCVSQLVSEEGENYGRSVNARRN